MNLLVLALVSLWILVIPATVFPILIIDSYDCNHFRNGWDKICETDRENHKQSILTTTPIIGIIFTVLFIILIPKTASQSFTNVEVKEN